MVKLAISKQALDKLIEKYMQDKYLYQQVLDSIRSYVTNSDELMKYIHSFKFRTKDPENLRNKILRKAAEAKSKGNKYGISVDNLHHYITDLAGFRILHLHTNQIKQINEQLIKIFDENNLILKDGPFARTWDDESREFFKSLKIKTEESESMYTSVHYVIELNNKFKTTCEIQVRTLMEEVWAEVAHKINYPKPSGSIHCREQIKVLARVTSSASRLVDSIFNSHEKDQG